MGDGSRHIRFEVRGREVHLPDLGIVVARRAPTCPEGHTLDEDYQCGQCPREGTEE